MKNRVIVPVLVLALLLPANLTFAQQFIAPPIGSIDCDGSSMVWASYLNKNWEIFYENISTGQQKQITTDTFNQVNPSVQGNKIAWQDDRDGKEEIYLYDLTSKSQEKISSMVGDNAEPLIRGNYVVWVNEKDGYRNIALYDLKTKVQKLLTNKILAYGVDFDGEYVVWEDSRSGSFDIYMYDLVGGKEQRVTYYSGDETNPKISNGQIVYSLEYEGTAHIHQYDIAAGEESKLTAGDKDNEILTFSDGQLIMTKGNEVILKDTSTAVEKEIATVDNSIPNSAFLFCDKILWLDEKGLQTDSVKTALERAEENPASNNNAPTSTISTSSSNSQPGTTEEKEYTLKVEKGKDTTFDLDSGKINLYISGANIISGGEIKVLELNDQVSANEYSPMTKVYQLSIPDGITTGKVAQFTVKYGDYENGEKVRIYQVNEKPKALKLTRDRANSTISAQINNNNKVAVLAYVKQYNDIMNHWSKQYFEELAAQQMINGYLDGTIKPNENITRAEFMKILVNYFADENQSSRDTEGFTDCLGHWAEKDLLIAKEKGWLQGYEGKAFPNDLITREEMITILMRISEKEIKNSNKTIEQFSDASTISDWSRESIQKAISEGVLQGDNGRIKPKTNATRAESITMIYKFLDNRSMI